MGCGFVDGEQPRGSIRGPATGLGVCVVEGERRKTGGCQPFACLDHERMVLTGTRPVSQQHADLGVVAGARHAEPA